ncbi:MAG: hypothetical protein WAQ28_01460 [Bacteroidia bacterium]
MKKFVAIFLVFAMLMQLFGSVAIIANYVLNKEYISKTFCVNRSKPKMRCNGKCHLMKQLQKENKKEKSPLAAIKMNTQIQFVQELHNFVFVSETATVVFPDFISGEAKSASIPVFHPPSFC